MILSLPVIGSTLKKLYLSESEYGEAVKNIGKKAGDACLGTNASPFYLVLCNTSSFRRHSAPHSPQC